MYRSILGAAVAIIVAGSSAVKADTVMDSDSFPAQATNWAGFLVVDKFDPSLGTLNSVKVKLEGSVSGTASYENLGGSPEAINLNLQASITLTKPDNTPLVQVVPLVNQADNASAFDGTIDFGGTSGNSFANLNANAMDMDTLVSPADLALFTGPGTISLPISATGTSFASGGGNLIAQFLTEAGASMMVTYDYTPFPVPEPSTFVLLGMAAIFGLVIRNRRKTS